MRLGPITCRTVCGGMPTLAPSTTLTNTLTLSGEEVKLVMDYVSGRSLKEIVQEGPIEGMRAAELLLEVSTQLFQ